MVDRAAILETWLPMLRMVANGREPAGRLLPFVEALEAFEEEPRTPDREPDFEPLRGVELIADLIERFAWKQSDAHTAGFLSSPWFPGVVIELDGAIMLTVRALVRRELDRRAKRAAATPWTYDASTHTGKRPR